MLILEYWLGKRSKRDVADELGVTPLRVWQMSQQAVTGMIAGLLKQPRSRRGRPPLENRDPQNDPAALRKRIAQLEQSLRFTEELVQVLRTAPWAQPPKEEKATGRKRVGKKGKRPNTNGRRVRAEGPDRSPTPKPEAHAGRAGGAGSVGGPVRPDAE